MEKKKNHDHLLDFLDKLGRILGHEATFEQIQSTLANKPGLREDFKGLLGGAMGEKHSVNPGSSIQFVRVLAEILENKDPFTCGHSSRVSHVSNLLAKKLGITETEQRDLQIGAYLHDLGKLGVDFRIVCKEGAFSRKERLMMRRHPLIGVDLVSAMGLSPDVISIIRHHHEFFNGTGYPDGLKGGDIPLLARIVSLSECFDAMVSARQYRKAIPLSRVVRQLNKFSGVQFDPKIVGLLLESIEEKGKDFLAYHKKSIQRPDA